MSDNYIIIIPESPDYIPPLETQRKAEKYFGNIAPRADQIKAEATEEIRFIDCGANLSTRIARLQFA